MRNNVEAIQAVFTFEDTLPNVALVFCTKVHTSLPIHSEVSTLLTVSKHVLKFVQTLVLTEDLELRHFLRTFVNLLSLTKSLRVLFKRSF